MAVPGFSISDLIQALGQAKIVYDAFFHEYASSKAQLRNLRDDIAQFQLHLQEQQKLFEDQDLEYSSVEAVNRTLAQCYHFLEKYKPVLDERRRRSFVGAVKAARFPFDDEVADLRTQIGRHQTNLIHFNVLHIMRQVSGPIAINRSPRTVPIMVPELPSPLSTSPGSLPSPIMQPLDFGSRLTRRSNSRSAERLPRVPEDFLPGELEANIITELPADPVPERTSPIELASPHKESTIESLDTRPFSTISSPSQRNPARESVGSISTISSTSHHNPARESVGSISTISSTGQHNPARESFGLIPTLILPQLPLSYVVAEVLVGNQKIKLKRKAVGNDFQHGREMVIMDEHRNIRFQHWIKGSRTQSCFPYTWYRDFQEKDFVIDFKTAASDAHSISFKGAAPLYGTPKYVFTKKEDFEDFQSELRKKRLEATFDALKVSTSSSLKFPDASKQQLKIWHDVDRQVRSVSYFANSMKVGQHREFPLAMFEQELGFDKSEKAKMTLNFTLAPERKRPRTGSSVLSRSPTELANTIVPSIFSSGGTEVASSASSITTASSRTTTGLHQFDSAVQLEESKDEQSLRSLAKDMKYLRVTFYDEKEAARFKETFRTVYDEEAARPQNEFMYHWQMGLERNRTESVTSGNSPTSTPLTRSPSLHPRSPVLTATRKRTGTFRDI